MKTYSTIVAAAADAIDSLNVTKPTVYVIQACCWHSRVSIDYIHCSTLPKRPWTRFGYDFQKFLVPSSHDRNIRINHNDLKTQTLTVWCFQICVKMCKANCGSLLYKKIYFEVCDGIGLKIDISSFRLQICHPVYSQFAAFIDFSLIFKVIAYHEIRFFYRFRMLKVRSPVYLWPRVLLTLTTLIWLVWYRKHIKHIHPGTWYLDTARYFIETQLDLHTGFWS